jgi:hypothetical protein
MLVQDYSTASDITFGATAVGPTTVTLTSGVWSDISGIRAGYRFLVDDEAGEAFILDDPAYESTELNVIIIKPLLSTTYTSGNWALRVPRTKEVKDYLPRRERTTLILPDYMDSLQNVSIDELHDAAIRLRNIRRWNVMDPEYLEVFLQSLGLVFQTDEFDTETIRRFVKELPTFLELSGTKFYINYLGLVLNSVFTLDHLWSNNYIDFIPRDDIPGGNEEGWYPTNHVRLTVDAGLFGVLDTQTVVDLFYTLSSVPLVVQSLEQFLPLPDINVQSPSLITSEEFTTFTDITP